MRVGGQTIALSVERAHRFVVLGPIQPVPGAPAAVLGLTLVDSAPASVIDLARLRLSPHRASPPGVPPTVGLFCRRGAESVVLIGGKVRSVGRLRVTPGASLHGACRASRAVEYRGAAIPLLSLAAIVEAAFASDPGGWPR